MSKQSLLRLIGAACLTAASLCAPVAAQNVTVTPGGYSGLYIFGDSLTDTGNLYIATSFTQPPAGQPYFNGRFSNGPLWVEGLATGLGYGSAASPYLTGGNNYAYAGARTATSNSPPGVLAQEVGIWNPAHSLADPNALYVVVGGGNDMRDARTAFTTTSVADQAGRQAAAQAAINNLVSGLSFLASKGAKNVLVANLPNLGNTPEAVGLGLQAASSDASARFDALFPSLIASGQSFGLKMSFLDMAGIAFAVRSDALNNGGALYGITNVGTPCAGFTGSTGISCNVSAFSDALHPSARVHQLFAQGALAAAVPEPQTYALMAAGLLLLAARRRLAA